MKEIMNNHFHNSSHITDMHSLAIHFCEPPLDQFVMVEKSFEL
jgi:hypothetical protein